MCQPEKEIRLLIELCYLIVCLFVKAKGPSLNFVSSYHAVRKGLISPTNDLKNRTQSDQYICVCACVCACVYIFDMTFFPLVTSRNSHTT